MKTILNITPAGWLRGAVYGLLLTGMYYSALMYLFFHDLKREDYSYGYLIPLVVLYIIWDKRERLASIAGKFSWKGFLFVGVAFCLFWLGELGGEYLTLYISLWFMITGLLWVHLGWNKLKALAFPLVMLLTMFPLPNFLYGKVSLQLKLISSKLGVYMMQAAGMSAFRQGNIIDLGFTQLQVVDACSGLRFLISLIVLALLLAYFTRMSFWKKAVVVISAVPLSVITNSLRIAVTGILHEHFGARVADGFFHGFSGVLIFMVSLALLLVEIWVLKKLFPEPPPASVSNLKPESEEVEGGKPRLKKTHSLIGFAVLVVLLTGTLVVSNFVEFREKIPMIRPFSDFPVRVGDWTGRRVDMEQMFVDALDLSDYVIVDYEDAKGRSVNFYVAYYESQRKGESIHSPETCLPGSGWVFRSAGRKEVNLGDGRPLMPVNRAIMEKDGQRQVSFFWFAQRGRILTNAYELKFYAFWDALTMQRTDGALVRLITPVYELEEPAQAEKRLEAFMRELVPILAEYLPGRQI